MKKLIFFLLCLPSLSSVAQTDSTTVTVDSTQSLSTVQDAVYNRPFIVNLDNKIALGGYAEANTNYYVEDGLVEGFSSEFRRFNFFTYSAITNRIRFLSELEFEHGTAEIALETAQFDFRVNSAFVLRAGIILIPIGRFNQNHDSPQWEFIDRPLVSTEIIPSTLSDVGFGVNGKFYKHNWVFTYDAYLTNGLGDGIILNEDGRTFLQAGKREELFEEDNNGSPALSGKVGIRHRQYGEIGLSAYTGVYNTFRIDGEIVDERRRLSILAFDFSTSIKKMIIKGEFAYNAIQLPENTAEAFGNRQWGGFVDFIYPVYSNTVLGFDNTTFFANLRAEFIDYNAGTFTESGTGIGDEIRALVAGVSIRPGASTVIKINYRYHWIQDVLTNPTIRAANIQFGVASYF